MEEREIDLRMLFYKMLTKWRNAIVFAIVIGLLTGAYTLVKDLTTLTDADEYNAAVSAFEIEHNNWAATETILKSQMETITTSQARQEEYNRKSILMKIDPLQEYVGTMTIYVDYDYEIMPDKTYQNIDYTGRIMSSYSDFLSRGELYQLVLESTAVVDELKYLQEVLSAWVVTDTATIVVSVKGAGEADVNELLSLAYHSISDKSAVISDTVAEHSLTKVNESVYARVDFDLDETQKANIAYISECNQSLQEVALELDQWKKETEPTFEYTPWEIAKHVIKMLVLGGIIGCFAGFGWAAVQYVISHRLMDDSFWAAAGIPYFGCVWEKANPHRRFHKIDAAVDRLCGMASPEGGLAESCALVGANINGIMKNSKIGTIAIVGTEPAEQMQMAATEMRKQISGEIVYIGNILAKADAIASLEGYDCVIVAARETVTTTEDILRQKELLNIWGKTLAGAFSFK